MNVYALVAEVLVFVGLLVGGALAVRGFNDTQKHEAILQDRAQAAEAVADEQAKDLAKKQQLLDVANAVADRRGREKVDAERKLQELQRSYQNAGHQDKGVLDWLTTPVPDAIRRLRHAGDASGGTPEDGVRVPRVAPGATASGGTRRDQR